MTFASWVKQPTTIAGIAGLSGALTGVLSGAMSLPAAAATAVGAIVAMILPDNTTAISQSKTTTTDVLTLAETLAPIITARMHTTAAAPPIEPPKP